MTTTFAATSLPPEIRSAIFAHALAPIRPGDIRTIPALALLATSKQIYHETNLLPFQSNAISLPAITDSSTSATLKLLQRLSSRQLNAVRKLDLQLVGSTLDTMAAAKVLRWLRLGNDQWDLHLNSAARFLPPACGDLRELTLTVSSRDIAVPLADCSTGLHKALEVESSPFFNWLATFDHLRKLNVQVRLLHDDQYPQGLRDELKATLEARVQPGMQLQVAFEAVQTPDCFVDELDLHHPDSYMGLFGNICVVPQEFQHMYK